MSSNNEPFLRLWSLTVPDAEECTYPSGVSEEKCSELFNCGEGFAIDEVPLLGHM